MRHVEFVRRGGRVLEVTSSKPKVNAIDRAMSQEMGAAFALLRDGPDLWCAILTEAGDRIFSSGWDLKALNQCVMALEFIAFDQVHLIKGNTLQTCVTGWSTAATPSPGTGISPKWPPPGTAKSWRSARHFATQGLDVRGGLSNGRDAEFEKFRTDFFEEIGALRCGSA